LEAFQVDLKAFLDLVSIAPSSSRKTVSDFLGNLLYGPPTYFLHPYYEPLLCEVHGAHVHMEINGNTQ